MIFSHCVADPFGSRLRDFEIYKSWLKFFFLSLKFKKIRLQIQATRFLIRNTVFVLTGPDPQSC